MGFCVCVRCVCRVCRRGICISHAPRHARPATCATSYSGGGGGALDDDTFARRAIVWSGVRFERVTDNCMQTTRATPWHLVIKYSDCYLTPRTFAIQNSDISNFNSHSSLAIYNNAIELTRHTTTTCAESAYQCDPSVASSARARVVRYERAHHHPTSTSNTATATTHNDLPVCGVCVYILLTVHARIRTHTHVPSTAE